MANVHPRLGALKDPVDNRDFLLRRVISPIRNLPTVVDYEKQMDPNIRDQGNRGACVGFAAAAVKEFQERKQRRFRSQFDFSEEWIYNQIMVPGGGSYPRDAFKLLADHGVPREKYMPYNPNLSDDARPDFTPSKMAVRNSKYYKAQSYARMENLDMMKQSLAINGPLMIGVDWFDGWFNPRGRVHEGYPILDLGQGTVVGGHAIAVVGYDDIARVFKFRNSWGADWAKGGYAYFSYEVVQANLWDAWAVLDMNSKNVKTEEVNKLKEQVNG